MNHTKSVLLAGLILAGASLLTPAARAAEAYFSSEEIALSGSEAVGAINALLSIDSFTKEDQAIAKAFLSRGRIVSIEAVKNEDGSTTYYYRAAQHPLMSARPRLYIRVASACSAGPAPADGGSCHNVYYAGNEGESR